MKKHLNDLTVDEFSTLKRLGFLYDLYPDAPETWSDIKKYQDIIKLCNKILASNDNYDIIVLKKLATNWLNEYRE